MRIHPKLRQLTLWIAFIIALVSLTACGDDSQTPSVVLSPTPTQKPLATPTPSALGSESNPFNFGLVLPQGVTSSDDFISRFNQYIADETGLYVNSLIYTNTDELISALEKGNVHSAWLQPLTYIYAAERGWATAGLLSNHFGTYYYGFQFLGNQTINYTFYFDQEANKSVADAATALRQLNGTRPCWVEEGSISGYIFPLGILEENQIITLPGAFLQSHTAVVRALYIEGICDFGVTFAISGDPRTSSAVIDDLTDTMERIQIIWQSNAEIPNLNLSYSTSVPETIQKSVSAALQSLVKTDDGKQILMTITDGYDIQDLRQIDDSVYDPLRNAITFAGTDVSHWIGK